MPAKKPRKKASVRFRPGQKVRELGIHTTSRFFERWLRVFEEEYNRNLRIISKLTRKRALEGLTPEEREKLAEAYKNMRRLVKKLEQVYAERAKQASEKVKRDPKFGIFLTDRYFKEMFRIRGKEHRRSLLAFLDIDYLKEINDGYGHKAGDIVIRSIGEALNEAIGEKGGLIGRHGGEEILVWAPIKEKEFIKALKEASKNAKEMVAKRMRKEGIRFLREASFSAGIVPVSADEIRKDFREAYKRAIESAEELMYESKRKGRDAITIRSEGKLKTIKVG